MSDRYIDIDIYIRDHTHNSSGDVPSTDSRCRKRCEYRIENEGSCGSYGSCGSCMGFGIIEYRRGEEGC